MDDIKRLEGLKIDIIQWSHNNKYTKTTPEDQFLRFIENTGKLSRSVLMNNSKEFTRAIGDVFLDIVLHSELCEYNFKINYINSPDRFFTEMIRSMIDCVRPYSYTYAISHLIDIRRECKELANNKTIADCVECAYSNIQQKQV